MEPNAKKIDPKMIIIAVAAVIVLIVGIIVIAKVAGDSPKKAVARLETAFNEKDLDKFADCLVKKDKEEFEELIDLYKNSMGDDADVNELFFTEFAETEDGEEFDLDDFSVKIKVNEVKKDGDSAKAKVTFKVYKDKKEVNSEDSTIKLKKEGKKWKIVLNSITGDEEEEDED